MKNRVLYLLMALMAFNFAACHRKYIEHTKIRDTADNRAILDLMETYRRALEEKDADTLVSLCAPHYYEDMGNNEKSDDFTKEEFQNKVIPDIFAHTDELYLDITIDELETTKNLGHIDFRFDYRAHLTFPAGGKWLNDTAHNRFELVKIDDKWLVVSGL